MDYACCNNQAGDAEYIYIYIYDGGGDGGGENAVAQKAIVWEFPRLGNIAFCLYFEDFKTVQNRVFVWGTLSFYISKIA